MTYKVQGLSYEQQESLAQMLGLPRKYAAKAARVLELWEPTHKARPTICRPQQAFEVLQPMIGRKKKEHLVGLYLSAQNAVLHVETISVGSLNTTRTVPREVFYPAISNLALGLILAHNHPSGSLAPSDEDVAFTRSLARAGELLGIELYDHLIITADGFTSLRERGAF